ncbi:ATP-binding protein [Aliarcobacter butzleri]|uniref:AAA family ATPase n=1 Tax=Aliarcobacter butzleri TaxID=28197 RepID=UPI001EDC26B8|nr:AAA family ATPase [Aliarcobacter butzleri]MCG3662934.1 ATP-binding protein [Aliarcobacter butzleri]
MELVYLWVENYKNIHKQGFNFSPRFRCEYDEEKNELEIIDKEETGEFYPKNFFGDNINITAIVGENGSGKSSILDLFKNKKENNTDLKRKAFYVYYENEEFYYYGGIPELKNIIRTKLPLTSVSILSHSEMLFSYNLTYLNGNKNDTSIYLKQNEKYNYFDNNFFIPKYIDFIRQKNNFIDFNIHVDFDILRIIFNEPIFNNEKTKDINKLLCNRIAKKLNINSEVNSYNEIIKQYDKTKDNYHEIVLALKTLGKYTPKRIQYISEHIYFDIPVIKNKLFNEDINNLSILQKTIKGKYGSNFSIQLVDLEMLDSKTNTTYTSMSSGEKNFLRLQVENLCHKDSGHMDQMNIYNDLFSIYLYDEVETSFHPNLQKKIFNLCINLFKNFRNHKFNLIFATHSPFILSDIPKENVIFLDKFDEETKEKYPKLNIKDLENGNCINVSDYIEIGQTFGANIHTLLSHGFFMKDGLMGEFAKEKINQVYNFITQKGTSFIKTKEEAQNIINLIGEPMLKKELQYLYDEKFEIGDIDKQIREHEEAIEKLKSKKKKND